MQMAWGVVIGHEPMPVGRWIGFALIWVALVVMTIDAVRKRPAEPISADVDLAAPESSSR
jgi:chloramphenicol-sensitive protein RarD